MPIQSGDIKLLKSAVMADTPEGGGAMTGTSVVDGQSNNIFPDSSAMDRAFGRFAVRKLFGVAHTSDTDSLMGTHVIVTDAPDDPLVHCTLFKTTGWSDTRVQAQATVERYLARGPVMSARIYDVHYEGSRQLSLITFTGAPFPEAGDAIIIVNPPPGNQEQYARIIKKTVRSENVSFQDGPAIVTMPATIATLELAQALEFDVFGPTPSRIPVDGNVNARLFNVTAADGAYFYGIKPLEAEATPGARFVQADGGIFTNLVPAATVETPIIDQRPYATTQGMVSTGLGTLVLPSQSVAMTANAVLTMPGPVQPGTLRLTFSGTVLLDDGQGVLQNAGAKVGSVDYLTGKVTLGSTVPAWGTQSVVCDYTPASPGESSISSTSIKISLANRGLAFVTTLRPLPMAATAKVSYMAQGRWYDLVDNGSGKLVGAAPEYGIGTLNYTSGSLSLTLGAIPDIDSHILVQWGDAQAAERFPSALPTKLHRNLSVPGCPLSGVTIEWTSGGAAKTAVSGLTGALSGDATGYIWHSTVRWEPNMFPDAGTNITVTHAATTIYETASHLVVGPLNAVSLVLDTLPVVPGTFRASLATIDWVPVDTLTARYVSPPSHLGLYDRDGKVYVLYGGGLQVGTIDYATGAVVIGSPFTLPVGVRKEYQGDAAWWNRPYWVNEVQNVVVAIPNNAVSSVSYSTSVGASVITAFAANDGWTMELPRRVAEYGINDSSVALTVGSVAVTSRLGLLYRDWNLTTGAGGACGTVSAGGVVHLSASAVTGGVTNTLSYKNLAGKYDSRPLAAGVFRTSTVPLKSGSFTLGNIAGGLIGTGSDTGVITGDFDGTIDYVRGIVRWTRLAGIDPDALTYNAVFLQYLPLDSTLLGLNTSRLPLDGRVPIFRSGDLCVVHNTQSQVLDNPAPRDSLISMGRERIAVVRVRDANGSVVPDTLYTVNLNTGTMTIPAGSNLTSYTQPLTVENRIEDLMVCSVADISGKLEFTRGLTHTFPLGASFVSSALTFGDLFARAHALFEQSTWTGTWADAAIGSVPLASFNAVDHPIVVTNRGAITERWVLIFQTSTTFIVVGQSIGQIATGNVNTDCAPLNTATSAPYFTLPALGWGSGWAAGNVLRFNTAACGAPFWVARTILQGPANLDSDQFSIALRGDIDRP